MKKNLFILSLLILLVFSCSKKDDERVPSEVTKSLLGDYNATTGYVCIESPLDSIKLMNHLNITKHQLKIDQLYIGAIVDSVFGKGTAEEQHLYYQPLTINYALYKSYIQNVYALSYSPSQIKVKVGKNGKTHELEINIFGTTQNTGFLWYDYTKRNLNFHLYTSSIKKDNQPVTTFASYPDSIRKVAFSFTVRTRHINSLMN